MAMGDNNTDPTLQLYGQPQPQLAAAEETVMATAPVSAPTQETGFERVTGAAGRMGAGFAQINQRREQRRVFEENYMRGEAGVDSYEERVRQGIATRLADAQIPQDRIGEILDYALPSKEQFRDPETGNINFVEYWASAPASLVEFEDTIRERGVEAVMGMTTSGLQGASLDATSRDDYNRRAIEEEGFNRLATLDPEKADEVRTLYGQRWMQDEATKEADKDREAGVRRAMYGGRPADVTSTLRASESAIDQQATAAAAQAELDRLNARMNYDDLTAEAEALERELLEIPSRTYSNWENVRRFGNDEELRNQDLEETQRKLNRTKSNIARFDEQNRIIETSGSAARVSAGIAESAATGSRNVGSGAMQTETSDLYRGTTESDQPVVATQQQVSIPAANFQAYQQAILAKRNAGMSDEAIANLYRETHPELVQVLNGSAVSQ